MGAAAGLWLIPLVIIAFAVRTVLVLALRNRRPEAAAAVDRWWTWVPLAVVVAAFAVVCVVLIIHQPLLGIGLTIVGATLVYFLFFAASSTGSPFRPRRR